MSGTRVLVGTRKGAFILTSDAKRKDWKVDGPHFAGWEIYHMKGSPVDQNRIYASQTSAWFGQVIQRSDDGGKTWNTPGTSEQELRGPDGKPCAGHTDRLPTTPPAVVQSSIHPRRTPHARRSSDGVTG